MVDERPDEPTEEEGDPHHAEAADSAQLVEGDDEGLVDTEGDAAVPSEEDAGVAELAAEESSARRAQLGTVAGERQDRIRTFNFPQSRVTDHRLSGLSINAPMTEIMKGGPCFDRILDGLSEDEERRQIELIIAQAFS